MTARLRLWWQKIRKPLAIIAAIALLAGVLVLFILAGYRLTWTGFFKKTLWDWLNLLGVLAIPAVVGLGAAWFTAQQGKVSDQENKDNQHETALQAYIDKISELLLKEHLGELTADGKLKPEYDQVRKIARVRTITILFQLDTRRIGYVFAFLREAGLMSNKPNGSIVSLSQADLRKINLSQANLFGADLSGASLTGASLNEANLYEANLSEAFLVDADLSRANLIGANLIGAGLRGAILTRVNLSRAILSRAILIKANLSRAILSRASLNEAHLEEATLDGASLLDADLSGSILYEATLDGASLDRAILTGANLSGAILTGANLSGAKVSEEQLKEAQSLNGAIMPDGSIHP